MMNLKSRWTIPSLKSIRESPESDKETLLYLRWMLSPRFFIEEAMGISTLSNQQIQFLDELRNIVTAKWKMSLGDSLTEEDERYMRKVGISVRSGKGTGKDMVIANCMIWFLYLFTNPRVITTAPDATTLKNVLWSEVVKWLYQNKQKDGSPACLKTIQDVMVVQNQKIYRKQSNPEADGLTAFAEARTASVKEGTREQAGTLLGRHSDFLMLVVEEASEVSEEVLTPIMTTMTQHVNFAVLIWNPTRTRGFAWETHFGRFAESWIGLHWDAEESELVSKESIAQKEKLYGRDSNEFRISVKGLPPISDENTLIVPDWVYESREREISVADNYPIFLGVDCAGMGEDKIVLCPRQGYKVFPLFVFHHLDTAEIAGWVLQKARELEVDSIMIDAIGVGAGVYDQVKRYFRKTYGVNVSRKSTKEKFFRLRDELWWKMREPFERGLISLPNDPVLMSNLSGVKYFPENGKIKVEGKKEMKRRLGASPDRADALMLTYYMDDHSIYYVNNIEKDQWNTDRPSSQPESEYGWMAV